MTLIPNQSAIQNNVDGTTTGVIDEVGNPYNGQRVSLVFNDVDTVDGAPLVLVGGQVVALTVGEPDANLEVTGNLTVDGTTTLTGSLAAEGEVGFNGATPVGKSAAYTLTYSTAARTVPAATAVAVATTTSSQTTPYGYTTQAQADAIPVNINANAADTLAVKKLVVALINDLIAVGIAQHT